MKRKVRYILSRSCWLAVMLLLAVAPISCADDPNAEDKDTASRSESAAASSASDDSGSETGGGTLPWIWED